MTAGGSTEARDQIRVLLLADTHLGFDSPLHPRVQRRRRGPDFFRNFRLALEPALQGRVDVVVHGGDVFFRSRIPAGLVLDAIDCIRPVVARGVPVFIVPGNHERSALPYPMLWNIPGLFVFDRPRTFRFEVRGYTVALSGFPYARSDLRQTFPQLLTETDWSREDADLRLLCLHHACEGATVGPGNFRFQDRPDTIPGRFAPKNFAAILSGHIHRSQILRRDTEGRALDCPVLYPGSIERTSFAERNELKGYLMLQIVPSSGGGVLRHCCFRELPTRPMAQFDLDVGAATKSALQRRIQELLRDLDPSSIVRFRISGDIPEHLRSVLSAASLRSTAPKSMTVGLAGVRPR